MILKDGAQFSDVVKIAHSEVKKGARGEYLELEVITKDKVKIPAKKWASNELNELTQGNIVDLNAKVQIYNNKAQLIVTDATTNVDVDPDLFDECPMTTKELNDEFNRLYSLIENKALADLVKTVLSIKSLKDYRKAPAATKIHHAFEKGLWYHSVTMAQSAEALCTVYTYLNRDLLVAAALIHDSAKPLEQKDGEYTKEGMMFGHIILINDIIANYLYEKRKELSDDDKDILTHFKHIILSHHGKLEWGSPVLGLTPEAMMFHFIDKMDAEMMIMTTYLKGVEKGEITERIWALDSRRLVSF